MVARPELFDVLFDRGTRVAVDNEDEFIETGRYRVSGEQIDDRFTVLADGGELFKPTVSTSSSGGQNNQSGALHL
jgi:hypothetical protein